MARILSLDTSTTVCSLAIYEQKRLLAMTEYHLEQSHAKLLPGLAEEMVEHCGFPLGSLEAIAISQGPGSYTGLRIGTSTAKGLCYALDIPLIAVNTLTAMAAGVSSLLKDSNGLLCPMIDARRMEVYCLLADTNLKILAPAQPKIIDGQSFQDHLRHRKVYFFGNGSDKCKTVIQSEYAVFIEGVYPSARHVGALAYLKFLHNDFADLAYFEPQYLKEFRTTKPKTA